LIFVTLGTHEQPFNRLLEAVDKLTPEHDRIVQYGFSTYPMRNCSARRFFEFDDMRRLTSSARVIVTHAGVGSIMLALAAGKRPVVAPRLYRFGEHVDDHQLEIAEQFAKAGKVILFMPGDDLEAKIAEANRHNSIENLKPSIDLVDFLKDAISSSVFRVS